MTVVSDTTALTTWLKVGHEGLLEKLFDRVLSPSTVERELRAYHATLPPFCQIRPIAASDRLQRLLQEADAGEAEAICLAVEVQAQLLLIEDKKGRQLAEAEGLRCLGLPAVLLQAKRSGLISSLAEMLDQIEKRGNFGLSGSARMAVLRQAGE